MAITLADFTYIWASTTPLTPYSFSQTNYEEGWNFVGSTPPSRQMWDSIQKQNDEKMKYIVDNFLPLAGGTMTGSIVVPTASQPAIKNDADDGYTWVFGGTTTSDGAWLTLRGINYSSNAGAFSLSATDGNGTTATLMGHPSGTFRWNGYNVLTDATVGTVVTNSNASNVELSANTSTEITSVTLTAGTWVVNGHLQYTSVVARQFAGLNDSSSINAGVEGTAVHYAGSTSGTTLALNVTRIFVLASSTTIKLNGFASASCTAGTSHITAVRIV